MPPVKKQKTSSLFPRILTIAGASLTAYGIYSMIAPLTRIAGTDTLILDRVTHLVSVFPLVFMGNVLVILGRSYSSNSLSSKTSIFYTIIKSVSIICSALYIMSIPALFIGYNLTVTKDNNLVNRMSMNLEERRSEIHRSVSSASTIQNLQTVIERYPELSITIPANSNPETLRNSILDTLNNAAKSQKERTKLEIRRRHQAILATTLSTALASLLSGMAFTSIASEIVPVFRKFIYMLIRPFSFLWKPLMKDMGLLVAHPNESSSTNKFRRRKSNANKSLEAKISNHSTSGLSNPGSQDL